MKMFQNNVTASKKVMFEAIKDLGEGFLPIANDVLKAFAEMEDGIGKTAIQIGTLTLAMGALYTATTAFFNIAGMAGIAGALANPMVAAGIIAVTAGLTAGTLLAVKMHNKQREINYELIEQRRNIDAITEKRENALKQLEMYNIELKTDPVERINEQWKNQIDLIGKSISKIKELQTSITGVGGIGYKPTDSEIDISDLRKTEQIATTGLLDTQIAIEKNKEALIAYQKELKSIFVSLAAPDTGKRKKDLEELIKTTKWHYIM